MPISKKINLKKEINYFNSIQEFLNYLNLNLKNHKQHRNQKQQTNFNLDPKLIVAHDFKGGYSNSNYSFEWLASVDTFIYFSHHRISIPPTQWITAANTHHTKILGTLIFEGDASQDLVFLINGPESKQPQSHASSLSSSSLKDYPTNYYINLNHPFDSISTFFADRLIDLAIYHGFHGWLINIELDLLKSRPKEAKPILRALKIWLEYFRLQGTKRIGPDWQVCWYDAISYFDGSLSWQSQLHPLHNLPFFSSSSSIFLDYHWSPKHISATEALVKQLVEVINRNLSISEENSSTTSSAVIQHQEPDLKTLDLNWSSSLTRRLFSKPTSEKQIKQTIFFGVDVFGRGVPFGGGFSSWRAAHDILSAGFSVALFAPGWTWESETLGNDRLDLKEGDPQWWSLWWRDERYFWAGLLEKSVPEEQKDKPDAALQLLPVEPPNAYLDSLRIAIESKKPAPRRGLGYSELPRHRPLLDLFPVRPDYISESFYTNWSLGSGHGFWVQGRNHLDRVDGIGDWSDMSMSFPIHDLSIGGAQVFSVSNQLRTQTGIARCDLTQHIGWYGSGSVEIEEQINTKQTQSTVKYLWLNTTSVECANQMKCRLVWRPIDPKNDGLTTPLGIIFQTSQPSGQENIEQDPEIFTSKNSNPSVKLSMIHIDLSTSTTTTADLKISKIQSSQLEQGWFQSTCCLQTNQACSKIITRIGITISTDSAFSHHIGEFSLVPVIQPNSHIDNLESSESIVERPLKVTWEPDQTIVESDQSSVTDVNKQTKKDSLSGEIKWEINSPDQYQYIQFWLIYLQKPNSKPGASDDSVSTDQLVAVVKDIEEIHLSVPFGEYSNLGPFPCIFISGIHVDYSMKFAGSCQLFLP